jgi:CTP:molybdopterin cytidylyltransferase MocA
MDAEALAALAGSTVVTVAVTDAFETVRHRVARVFGRGKPDAAIERRLDATRQQLATAEPGEAEALRISLAGQWQARFADVLADQPELAAEVDALIADLRASLPAAGSNVTNTIRGGVVHGPVIMGRDFGDVTIESPPRPDAEQQ